MLAPICLFTYNRYKETQLTLEALQKNNLAAQSELFIFSDGPKNEQDKIKVDSVRQLIKSSKQFKSVQIIESEKNSGLASSIIQGVAEILNKYESVIVLEDDLITSPNFLDFMNQALSFYQENKKIQSINGYSLDIRSKIKDIYFHERTCPWGWATWKDRWNLDIFDKSRLKNIIESDASILKNFKKKCGADIPKMLTDSISNKNNSWYVRWAFDHFINNRYAVYPSYSFVTNIGHNEDATHCKGVNTYKSVPIDPKKTAFNFIPYEELDYLSNRDFLAYFSLQHKIKIRIKLLKTAYGRNLVLNELKMKCSFK